MSLPYIYKSKIEVPDTEDVPVNEVINALASYFDHLPAKDFEFDEGTIRFVAQQAFINFSYPVEIKVEKDEIIYIHYQIHLMQLIKITLALVVFIAFFSSFGFSGFLWFSFIFSIAFYFVNLIFADSYIQKIIKKSPFYQAFDPFEREGLSDEQIAWLHDKSRCPACGEEISDWDLFCPECGLRLKQNNFTVPLDVSKYKEKRFTYHYKEQKKTHPRNKENE